MVNWNEKFDHIFCLYFLGHKDRFSYINEQLDRVGITSSGIFEYHYSFPVDFFKILQNTINIKSNTQYLRYEIGSFNAVFNFYLMMKESVYRCFNHVLFLESDASFIEDTGLLKEYLDTIPNDYDFIMFDFNQIYANPVSKPTKINDHWYKFDRTIARHTLCTGVAMSTRMMERMIWIQEHEMGMSDDIWNNDDPELKKMNYYIPDRRIVIQHQFDNRISNSFQFNDFYRKLGVDLNVYHNYM